jgi:hypothetical protein
MLCSPAPSLYYDSTFQPPTIHDAGVVADNPGYPPPQRVAIDLGSKIKHPATA